LFEHNALAQNGLGGSPGLTASVGAGIDTGGYLCEGGLCCANLARRSDYLTNAMHLATEAPTARALLRASHQARVNSRARRRSFAKRRETPLDRWLAPRAGCW
jgi:hypothetical protein